MSGSLLKIPHFRRTSSPKRDIALRLHNHIYVFTSSVGTQTDPEIFFVNGKPARAVKPFRVVLPPEKPEQPPPSPELGSQSPAQEPERAPPEPRQAAQEPEPQQAEAEEQEPEQLQQEVQQEQEQQQLETQQQEMQDDANLQDIAQALVPQVEWPLIAIIQTQWVSPLQTQETQTELQDLQRQLLTLTQDEAGSSSSSSSSDDDE